MSSYKFVGANSDDVEIGSLQLTGNAVENHVVKDTTFYTLNPKQFLTGIMEPGNINEFNLSVSSGRNIIVKWTNPIEELGKPYSGVYIRYQTGSYPTPTTGTQAYKGLGSSQESGGISTLSLSLPSLNTTYYFIIYSYCTTSNGEMLGTQLKATINTGSSSIIRITSSQSYTVPAGYNLIDVFCVGGGGGSEYGDSDYYANGGGGAGYTKTVSNIAVVEKDVLSITIGNGGYGGNNGGATSVKKGNNVLCSANGGSGNPRFNSSGKQGGSGGGGGGTNDGAAWIKGGNGGSNGGGGGQGGIAASGGPGQGSTTRAFGESNGTLYAGGGGGGGFGRSGGSPGGGGSGGGGGGSNGNWQAGNGGTNTGGGGGGNYQGYISTGGSGVVLIRLK